METLYSTIMELKLVKDVANIITGEELFIAPLWN